MAGAPPDRPATPRQVSKGTAKMLVKSFEAAAFGTNCYILAAGPGEPCVIVDPGIGVVTNLDALLLADGLGPAPRLLTHRPLHHCFSRAPGCVTPGITP